MIACQTDHPQLMHKAAHQHGPVLRRIRALVNLVGDHAAQPRLLGKPFPRRACDGVPANLDGAQLAIDPDLAGRHNIGLFAETNLVLQRQLALDQVVLTVEFVIVSPVLLVQKGGAVCVLIFLHLQKCAQPAGSRCTTLVLLVVAKHGDDTLQMDPRESLQTSQRLLDLEKCPSLYV